MKLVRNKPRYAAGPKEIVVTELSAEELALMRFLANLCKNDVGFPEGILQTVGRWESAGDRRPLYASFRELDRLTRLFEYLGINLRRWPDKLEPATSLRDSLHQEMVSLAGVVDCRR